MLKYFSRILIFTLLLTAPLSFTGDKCPDFKPFCDIKQSQKQKPAAVIVQKRSVVVSCHLTGLISLYTAPQAPLPGVLLPTRSFFCLLLHERAPPVTTLAIS